MDTEYMVSLVLNTIVLFFSLRISRGVRRMYTDKTVLGPEDKFFGQTFGLLIIALITSFVAPSQSGLLRVGLLAMSFGFLVGGFVFAYRQAFFDKMKLPFALAQGGVICLLLCCISALPYFHVLVLLSFVGICFRKQ